MLSLKVLSLFKNDEFYTVNVQLSFPVPRYVGKLYLHRTIRLVMTSFSRDLSNLFLNKLQDTAFIKVSHHAVPRSNRFLHLSVGLKIRHNISYMKGTSG